ncbi:hypothetical protein GRI44_13050 [Altererythrobacter confluentis]|uniref:Uncharacterized protein n=1 Tax=Allopontixanthobacter confluentis TaxID=1849021 RepID=A0A6L7GIB4_9SPHN|nr:hypothetical protein [Allopontixanthobacter confluentis]MXP15677.1 hypothetical protein [Allopontixanthobacter confluentis]
MTDKKKDRAQEALAYIEKCLDTDNLRNVIVNARRHGELEVIRAAQLRLYELLPSEEPGTLEHDVWRCIHALEDALAEERGKTVRLSRTRQKIGRDGEHQTVIDLVNGKQSSGFDMMIARNMPQYTFEAVTLRHPSRFADKCRDNAAKRLAEAGVPGGSSEE